MTTELFTDIMELHDKFGHREIVADFDRDKLKALFEFRKNFLREEMRELDEAESAEDAVDALIDLVVVALGTLDLFQVDAHDAWDEVHHCNMTKESGVKESRPNPLGLPDMVKPEGWMAPSHEHNTGLFDEVFDDDR